MKNTPAREKGMGAKLIRLRKIDVYHLSIQEHCTRNDRAYYVLVRFFPVTYHISTLSIQPHAQALLPLSKIEKTCVYL